MSSRRPYKAYLYQSSNMLEDNQFYLVTEIYLNEILSDFHYAESFYSVVNLGDIYYRET